MVPYWLRTGRPSVVHNTASAEIRRTAEELGLSVHIHSLESVLQKIHGLTALSRTHIAFMRDIGFLGPEIVLAHSVWATENDIQIIAESGAGVTHQPSSNLRLRSALPRFFTCFRREFELD